MGLLQATLANSDTRKAAHIEALWKIASRAAEVELQILESGEASLREVVGARTRAIHDLQLLEGRATERVERVEVSDVDRAIQAKIEARMGPVGALDQGPSNPQDDEVVDAEVVE